MTRILHDDTDITIASACADGDALWLDRSDVARATGWSWKPEGLCRDESCMPLPCGAGAALADGDRLDVAGFWRSASWPVAHDRAGEIWVLGESASTRAGALASLEAPDIELPDLAGRMHRLAAYRGRRIFLITWASWCGCRLDLPHWQLLTEETRGDDFVVIAVALDEPEAARPWIEGAGMTCLCLIDREHRLAELYHLTNVPQAVWIDERGRIVRPPENAGASEGFRTMDRETLVLPDEAKAERDRLKSIYREAVKDWAKRGAASPNALDAKKVAERLPLPHASVAEAHARFRLAQALRHVGREEEAQVEFAEASRLHPESWAIWRQGTEKNATGLATTPAFWERVDALGDKPYHRPMPIDDSVRPL